MASQVISYFFFFSFHLHIIYAHLFESNNKISFPLKILNQLNGIQKGNHRKGVNELKKHLSYLGYMNCHTSSSNHENEEMFDGCLELALRKYQEFFNLKITGTLDANTISKMREPRCGLPDIYNPKFENTTSFHMISQSHYAFFPGYPKWRKNRLNYAFNRNVKKEAIPPVERALQQWASATPFRFYRVSNLNAADIKISFMRGYHGDGNPFVGPDAGLAHTFAPPDGRVHFDSAQNWSTHAAKNMFDIQTVGLHELGHALGLGHSRIKMAAMYPTVNPGERKGLHEDDIRGIKVLYHL